MAATKEVSETKKPVKTPTLAQMVVRVPALDAASRAAFTAQYTPVECVTLGAQTRSVAVRECAMQWAAGMLKAVTGPEKELVPYAPERLSFVLELIGGLDAVRGANAKTNADSGSLRSERDLARTRHAAASRRLESLLVRATKGDEAASAEVAQLRGHGKSDRESAEATQSLVRVARKLLQGTKAQKLVAASVCLTAARVEEADVAARALLDARDDVALGASGASQKDNAAVNVVEGRVLLEMRMMKASIEEAREDGATVPALVPTAGVVHVFNKKTKKKQE